MIGHLTPSRHRIRPFELHRPETVDEAAGLLATLGDDALAMAGGVDVVNWLKDGLAVPHIVDLQGVAGLDDIDTDDGVVRLGALVTHRRLERSPEVEAAVPGLSATWGELGNVRIRMAGTVVGNLVAGAAHYDAAPVLLTLDARAVLADGARIPLDQLPARGSGRPPALVTAVELPAQEGQRIAYNRELKPAVTVAVALRRTDEGFAARVSVGCALPAAAAAAVDLAGLSTPGDVAAAADEVARAAVGSLPPFVSDHRGSAAYRRQVAGVLAARELRGLARSMDAQA